MDTTTDEVEPTPSFSVDTSGTGTDITSAVTMATTELSRPTPTTGSTGKTSESGSGVIIGAAVGAVVGLLIVIGIIIVVYCYIHRKRKANSSSDVKQKRTSITKSPPGVNTLRFVDERSKRPQLTMKEDNLEDDENAPTLRNSGTTFYDIKNGTEQNVSKGKRKRDKIEVSIDERTGLPIYAVELPPDGPSSGQSRKKSLQDLLGIRKNSYSVNPNERKGSFFTLPDMSYLPKPSKKKGNSKKSTSNKISSDRTDTDESMFHGVPPVHKPNHVGNKRKDSNPYAQARDIPKIVIEEEYTTLDTVTENETENDTVVQREEVNTASNILGDYEEEYTALDMEQHGESVRVDSGNDNNKQGNDRDETLPETGIMDEEYTALEAVDSDLKPDSIETHTNNQHSKDERYEDTDNTGRYSVEYVNYTSRPTSSMMSTGDNYQGHTEVQMTIQENTDGAGSDYMNLKSVHISQTDIAHQGAADSPAECSLDTVDIHTESMAESTLDTVKPVEPIDVPQDKGETADSNENQRSSELYLNVSDVGNKVEYPEGYIPNFMQRPSGPYINVPTNISAVLANEGSSQNDLTNRHS